MQLFSTNEGYNLPILATLSGVEVTGLTDLDITCYVSKNGAAGLAVSMTGLVTEVDSVNMPGLYSIALPSSVLDTVGPIILEFSGASFDTYRVLGDVGARKDIAAAKSNTEGILTDLALVQADVTSLVASEVTISNTLAILQGIALGRQYKLSTPVYDTNGNLTSVTVESWLPANDPLVDSADATFTVTATYDASGKLDTYLVDQT